MKLYDYFNYTQEKTPVNAEVIEFITSERSSGIWVATLAPAQRVSMTKIAVNYGNSQKINGRLPFKVGTAHVIFSLIYNLNI